MRVSIIITNYNYADYLSDAIDSALNQSHPAHDVIVVDDGSTDNSGNIIESYGDHIVPLYKQNGGQCSCFNAGFSICEGDAVIFLDADDMLFPDAVQKHVKRMLQHGVVKSNGYLRVVNTSREETGRQVPEKFQPSGDYLADYLAIGPAAYRPAFTSGNCWSRRFLERVLPLPENLSIGADGLLTSIDLLFGRIESIDEPVCWYRVHHKNKGPRSYRFDSAYLEKRLWNFRCRINFSAEWARKLGYDVNVEKWLKACNWKMMLAAHAIKALGVTRHGPSPLDLFASAFHPPARLLLKNFALAPVLGLVGLLPRRQSLKIADFLLRRTWGRESSAAVCETTASNGRIRA